ncbi:hypothetical protein F3Y22_tig00111741pilonHSYRG00087 [Hibiscus syriacus]|uniref:F-box associated domain-containing protein n=1 Tax=Hibiscus syriacus TaxID=106335 RepID=A0A6A2YGN8_HIBSY|nr:hypothetical protein F3Y22_tig00111741pilonHSYRG00087 [Hibiscus syriacus]
MFGPAVSGPCNGLVCLRRDDKVSLWIPSIREFKILPQSSVSRPPLADFTSFDCLGFGDSWKEISAPDVYPYDGPPEFNIYINGFYYWQASGNFDYLLLSFDMVNEKFSTLPLPEFGVKRPLRYWKNGELFLETPDHELELLDPRNESLNILASIII